MKTAKEILSKCFLGVIDFNEAAALGAMEKYAKQESAELLKALKLADTYDSCFQKQDRDYIKKAIKNVTQ